jgi:hypothetical protein
MAAANSNSTRSSTPEFMTSETAGDLIAAILEMGVDAFKAASAERGTSTIDRAASDAGTRAVRQLREYHGTAAVAS